MADKKTGRLTTGTLYKSRGVFYGRITLNGKRITIATHCTTREAAEAYMERFTLPMRAEDDKAKLRHLEAEIRRIDEDVEEARRKANDYQITDLLQRLIATRPVSTSTRKDYRAAMAALSRFMQDRHPGIVRMSDITHDFATLFRDHIAERVKPGTVNLYLAKLKAAWSSLSPSSPNPWRGVHVPGRSTPRKDLTEEEFKSVMAEARNAGGDVAYMFIISAETAMRMSDCCMLRWDSIDMSRRTINIIPQKLKRTGKTVQIPMSSTVFTLLSARAEGGTQRGYVSPKLARAWASSFAQRRARRVFTAAGIPPHSGKSFHSIRVHAITRMLDAGIPLATVQALAGHASPEMTQHYYRMDMDRAREAIDRLSESNGHGEAETAKTPKGGGDLLSIVGALSPEQRTALRQLL